MKKYVLLFVLCLSLSLSLAGCETTEVVDPNTGEVTKVVSLDTEKADEVEAIAEAVVTTTGAASLAWPVLTPIAALLAGVLAQWRRMRPKLEEATKSSEVSFKAGEVLCEAFEMVKAKHPAVWNDVKPIIEKATTPINEIEKAIAGFRHKNI